MLAIGKMNLFVCTLTEDEMIFDYTMRAFLSSPIQLSCRLDQLSDSELDLFCNEEIIAIHQDPLLQPARLTDEKDGLQTYHRLLAGGESAIAFFNLADQERPLDCRLPEESLVRDIWRKTDLGPMRAIEGTIAPHSALIFRLKPAKT